uniref:Uncharacterized protein n=1 Tax=Molossus molossus TaxID=27622 RepID=A0A7J8JW32_MOLMO|nr:hypothetical protein HJG59_008057 [Molossus molossus]
MAHPPSGVPLRYRHPLLYPLHAGGTGLSLRMTCPFLKTAVTALSPPTLSLFSCPFSMAASACAPWGPASPQPLQDLSRAPCLASSHASFRPLVTFFRTSLPPSPPPPTSLTMTPNQSPQGMLSPAPGHLLLSLHPPEALLPPGPHALSCASQQRPGLAHCRLLPARPLPGGLSRVLLGQSEDERLTCTTHFEQRLENSEHES